MQWVLTDVQVRGRKRDKIKGGGREKGRERTKFYYILYSEGVKKTKAGSDLFIFYIESKSRL